MQKMEIFPWRFLLLMFFLRSLIKVMSADIKWDSFNLLWKQEAAFTLKKVLNKTYWRVCISAITSVTTIITVIRVSGMGSSRGFQFYDRTFRDWADWVTYKTRQYQGQMIFRRSFVKWVLPQTIGKWNKGFYRVTTFVTPSGVLYYYYYWAIFVGLLRHVRVLCIREIFSMKTWIWLQISVLGL